MRGEGQGSTPPEMRIQASDNERTPERAWRRPGKPTSGWLRRYRVALAYYGLVLSYLWRALCLLIVGADTWMGLKDPAFQREWLPWWGSVLLVAGIWVSGWVIGAMCSAEIRSLTKHPPWWRTA